MQESGPVLGARDHRLSPALPALARELAAVARIKATNLASAHFAKADLLLGLARYASGSRSSAQEMLVTDLRRAIRDLPTPDQRLHATALFRLPTLPPGFYGVDDNPLLLQGREEAVARHRGWELRKVSRDRAVLLIILAAELRTRSDESRAAVSQDYRVHLLHWYCAIPPGHGRWQFGLQVVVEFFRVVEQPLVVVCHYTSPDLMPRTFANGVPPWSGELLKLRHLPNATAGARIPVQVDALRLADPSRQLLALQCAAVPPLRTRICVNLSGTSGAAPHQVAPIVRAPTLPVRPNRLALSVRMKSGPRHADGHSLITRNHADVEVARRPVRQARGFVCGHLDQPDADARHSLEWRWPVAPGSDHEH